MNSEPEQLECLQGEEEPDSERSNSRFAFLTDQEVENADGVEAVGRAANSSIGGIVLAGAAYGVATTVVMHLSFLVTTSAYDLLFVSTLIVLVVSVGVGFFCAALSGSVAITLVLMFNSVSGGALTRRSAVALSGGMAGYLTMGPVLFFRIRELGLRGDVVFDLLLISIVYFAMVFGHVGAIWMASRHGVWNNLKQELERIEAWKLDPKQEPSGSQFESRTSFQFRIGHLMIGMIACSCVLALDRLCPHHELLIVSCVYVVLQTILIWADWIYFSSYQKNLLGV